MPKNPDREGSPRLMSISEIAAEYGVSRTSVHTYRRGGTFPQPVTVEGSTRLRFRADEVAAWFEANPKQQGKRTDLATRNEGAAVETTRLAVRPGAALQAARDAVQWLRAQLDEDERIAREAMSVAGPTPGAGQWQYGPRASDEGGRHWAVTTTPPNDTVPAVQVAGSGMSGGLHEEALAAHIARHDPERVLREVNAKRQIIDLYAAAVEERVAVRARMREVIHSDRDEFGRLHQEESELIAAAQGLAPVVRLLALPYADRPGYREEWRP
ncbi:hypothetical protein SGLAM104S_01610 [Streptomyces glaucescens]